LGSGKQSKYQKDCYAASAFGREYEAISYKQASTHGGCNNQSAPLKWCKSRLYRGVKDDAHVEKPSPSKVAHPIVYYGTSITKGGCASRT